jgi:hypothetical protein
VFEETYNQYIYSTSDMLKCGLLGFALGLSCVILVPLYLWSVRRGSTLDR